MKSVQEMMAHDAVTRMKCRARMIPLVRIADAVNQIRNLEQILIQKGEEMNSLVKQRDDAINALTGAKT